MDQAEEEQTAQSGIVSEGILLDTARLDVSEQRIQIVSTPDTLEDLLRLGLVLAREALVESFESVTAVRQLVVFPLTGLLRGEVGICLEDALDVAARAVAARLMPITLNDLADVVRRVTGQGIQTCLDFLAATMAAGSRDSLSLHGL